MTEEAQGAGVLAGVRVLDAAHQYSGAFAASLLRDFGADVIAVENPKGSPIRTMLPKRGLDSLWWMAVQRDKRNICLKLSEPEGRELYLELARQADVLVENFRPGTMERWGLGPADLEAAGVNAVMLRISGFGQTGPRAHKPGYGTVAEALSGFAHLNGFPDGPPALPSVTLADGVTAVFGALGVTAALAGRARNPGATGVQVVDASLVECLFKIIPNQVTAYDQLGVVMRRYGNSLLDKGVLRDLFTTADGRSVAIGGGIGAPSIGRTLASVGSHDLAEEAAAGVLNGDEPQVQDFLRRGHARIQEWVSSHEYDEVEATLTEAGVVFAPIYDVRDIVKDEQFAARGTLLTVEDDDGRSVVMSGIVPKISGSQVATHRTGGSRGAHTAAVLSEMAGVDEERFEQLRQKGVV